MTQNELNGIYEFWKGLPINKITDKEAKAGFLKIYLELNKKVVLFRNDFQELHKKYFEGKEEDLNTYNKIIEEMQSLEGEQKKEELRETLNPEIKESISEFNEIINSLLFKQVELNLERVDKNKFIDALVELEVEFTLDDLLILKDLYTE